jgi:hypothetical protein
MFHVIAETNIRNYVHGISLASVLVTADTGRLCSIVILKHVCFFPATSAEVLVPPLPVAAIFPICQRNSQRHYQVLTFANLTGHGASFAPVRSLVVTETPTSTCLS